MTIYQRILVPIDGSDTSALGLDEAVRLARLTGGALRVLHAIDNLSFVLALDAYAGRPGEWLEELRQEGRKLLDDAVRVAHEAGVPAEGVLREGLNERIADVVIAEARTWPADLIVLGTHGRRGLGRLLLGSDAEQILRAAASPVLLVRPLPGAAAAQDKAPERTRVSVASGALRIE